MSEFPACISNDSLLSITEVEPKIRISGAKSGQRSSAVKNRAGSGIGTGKTATGAQKAAPGAGVGKGATLGPAAKGAQGIAAGDKLGAAKGASIGGAATATPGVAAQGTSQEAREGAAGGEQGAAQEAAKGTGKGTDNAVGKPKKAPAKGPKKDPMDAIRYKMWLEHRQRLLEIVSDLNNKAPSFQAVRKTGVNSLTDNAIAFMTRTRENIQLLVGISQTQRTHGAINPFRSERPYVMSAVPIIVSNLERLEVDNKEFGKRIAEISSEVDSGMKTDSRGSKHGKVETPPEEFVLPDEALAKYKPFNIQIPVSDKARRQVFRPRIYFDVYLKDVRPLGRVTVQLYTEAAPVVVLQLVRACMCKMNDKFHVKRLFPNLWLEVEMPLEDNSPMRRPLEYDGKVIDHGASSNVLSFSKDYLQGFRDHFSFCLSFKPLNVANGSRVGFGRVVKNSKIFDCLQTYGTKNGTLSRGIIFSGCGVL